MESKSQPGTGHTRETDTKWSQRRDHSRTLSNPRQTDREPVTPSGRGAQPSQGRSSTSTTPPSTLSAIHSSSSSRSCVSRSATYRASTRPLPHLEQHEAGGAAGGKASDDQNNGDTPRTPRSPLYPRVRHPSPPPPAPPPSAPSLVADHSNFKR